MAQSLLIQASITNRTNGGFAGSKGVAVTTAGDLHDDIALNVTTSELTHSIPTSIGNAGYCVIVNDDATNYVDVGFATTVYPLRLPAGGAMVLALTPAAASLFLKANTAACKVRLRVQEA
ncbi:MAG: hypothetical protein PSV22_14400 [Pseudolabrys sp.]|nr:hypothetical protein [Pseudolabrys sp.]